MSNATWWRMAAAQNGRRRPRRTSWVRSHANEPVKVQVVAYFDANDQLRAHRPRPAG